MKLSQTGQFIGLCLVAGLSAYSMSVRGQPIQDDGPPPQVREALDACVKEAKAVLPAPGKELSESDRNSVEEGRKKVEACMTAKGFPPPPDQDPKFRAALDACVKETKVTKLKPGQRPSEKDRKKVDACLKKKGLTPPTPPAPKTGG